MKFNIRLATLKDALAMAIVHIRSWEVAYKDIIPEEFILEKNKMRPALYEKVITEDNKMAYVITIDNKVVGIMGISKPYEEASNEYYELYYLYLDPDYIYQGIGTKAIQFACDYACSLGKKYLIVWVLALNTNAISFYQKCGFTFDGIEKTVEYGKKLKCLRMMKNL